MMMLCALASVVCCVVGWILAAKKKNAAWAVCLASFCLTASAPLMEYHTVLNCVNKEDWGALLDVVPYLFPFLAGYVVILLLANIALTAYLKSLD